jgi:hypothetical protein
MNSSTTSSIAVARKFWNTSAVGWHFAFSTLWSSLISSSDFAALAACRQKETIIKKFFRCLIQCACSLLHDGIQNFKSSTNNKPDEEIDFIFIYRHIIFI